MTDIYIVRHGETESNKAGLWQGATDSPLTATGEEQVRRLAVRLRDESFDVVVSSDRGRAVATAFGLGKDFRTDAAWREPDLGAWEGRTYDEVRAMSSDDLDAFMRGEDVALGGAERLSDSAERLLAAYRKLVSEVGDGRALIVTHGLAIAVLTGVLLGTRRPNPLVLPGNTALVHLSHNDRVDRLHIHNDHTHLVDPPLSHRGGTEVVFIRHGETVGNVESRWQGQQDGELNATGRAQAKGAVAGLPELDVLYSSRLGRARETAEIIGDGLGLTPSILDGVEEFSFGRWEGLTRDEIREMDPDLAAAVFDRGEDLRRGGTGETWAELVTRVAAAVATVTERHEGKRIGIVSHGGTTRAYIDTVLRVPAGRRRIVAPLRNTATASFSISPRLTRVLDWNIAPHLER